MDVGCLADESVGFGGGGEWEVGVECECVGGCGGGGQGCEQAYFEGRECGGECGGVAHGECGYEGVVGGGGGVCECFEGGVG